MEDTLEEYTFKLLNSSISANELSEITSILGQQTSNTISSFLNVSIKSIKGIEQWSWQTLSKDFHQWIDDESYVKFFHLFHNFNRKLVLVNDEIPSDMKISLLLPVNVESINGALEQIESGNEAFLSIICLWFDTVSYLTRDYPEIVLTPIITHLNDRLSRNFLMTNQYKFYLKQLHEKDPPKSIFTSKQRFYLKTCSFSFYVSSWSRSKSFPFTNEEILKFINEDFVKMILVHSYTMDSWSIELLACIAHTTGLVCALCWWSEEKAKHIEIIAPSKDETHEHVGALIRIVSYTGFHQRIRNDWYTDETLLIDTGLIFLYGIVETQDLGCFINSKTNLPSTLISIAQISPYDRIRICTYGFLADVLSDDQLKQLKVLDDMSEFFFHIIEEAWKSPIQKWKKIPLTYLLKGFSSLSTNETIQTTAANSNKISLFIQLSDKYPIAYDIIWTLSFNSAIRKQLQLNESFTTKLQQINQKVENKQLQKTINGILWNINSHQDKNKVENKDEMAFDIMMSYSHKDKEICKQIYNELTQAGYKIWIDFDQMHGDAMDAMAQAIDQSRIILICMSEPYRRSNYCRAEAQYAFKKQINMVPILLQKYYKPDGWLSFLIGPLLYVDFSKYEFPKALEMLMKELKIVSSNNSTSLASLKSVSHALHSIVTPRTIGQTTILPENTKDWTVLQVHTWLAENDLPQMARLLSDMDGLNLIYFIEYMMLSDPKEFLSSLQQDSIRRTNESVSLIEVSRFRTLVERNNLVKFVSNKNLQDNNSKKKNAKYSTFCSII